MLFMIITNATILSVMCIFLDTSFLSSYICVFVFFFVCECWIFAPTPSDGPVRTLFRLIRNFRVLRLFKMMSRPGFVGVL